jgi:hypothetical protein
MKAQNVAYSHITLWTKSIFEHISDVVVVVVVVVIIIIIFIILIIIYLFIYFVHSCKELQLDMSNTRVSQ